MTGYLALAGVIIGGILLFVVALAARWLFAPRAMTQMKATTYESGVDPVGTDWAQSQIRYVTYAFLYVVFAVDVMYLFPWAFVARSADLGVAALVEIFIFVAVILLGLVHAARRGLLRWT